MGTLFLEYETKYLGNFYRGLQYIGRRIPDDGQSERLLLKYYNFMWQIRKFIADGYGISVLNNLEKFLEYTGSDDLDKQYYELVANALATQNSNHQTVVPQDFMSRKKTPFYIGTERYFEVTLQQAGIYASSITGLQHTRSKIFLPAILYKLNIRPQLLTYGELTQKSRLLQRGKVSIDPRCLNKLGKILKLPIKLSSNYGEYDALMRFLTGPV